MFKLGDHNRSRPTNTCSQQRLLAGLLLHFSPLYFRAKATRIPPDTLIHLHAMGSRFSGDTNDPAVNVTTWLFMIIMVFSVMTRIGTKFHLFKRLMVDDVFILASLVFGIAQAIAISMAVGAGYGDHYVTLSSPSLDQVMEVYISQLHKL